MVFRLPRPREGWRVFAGEVGVIVLGVLIALGAQQAVQDMHNRADAEQARNSIRGELQLNMARLASRNAVRPCIERRIEELQALVGKAAQTGDVDTPQWIGRPQYWTMQVTRWDALANAGRAALLRDDELAQFGLMYHWMRNITAEMIVEQADWAKLRTLQHLSRADAQVLFELNAALQDARYRHWRVTQHTAQLGAPARQLQLKTVSNPLPAPTSACVPMDTPRDEALRQAGSIYGEP
jgi:hypothetical protein